MTFEVEGHWRYQWDPVLEEYRRVWVQVYEKGATALERLDYMAEADDQSKQGGDIERAQVMAMLAIAEAINNLADEVRGVGTPVHPIHVQEQ